MYSKACFFGILACREAFSMDGLDLQAMVPALHGGVVVAVAFLAHAGNEAMGLQEAAIGMRTVLGTPIGMDDDAPGPLAPPERHTPASQVSLAVIRSDRTKPTTVRA